MPARSERRRLIAALALTTLVLSGCSATQDQDQGYVPPVGGGASAIPTAVASTSTGTPATPKTSITTSTPQESQGHEHEHGPTPSGTIDDSSWRDIPATAEAEAPETSENERYTRGSSPWVASQVVTALNSSDYTEQRYGAQRLALRPYVTDNFWAYIGGPALSAPPDAKEAALWAQIQQERREVEVVIDLAKANSHGRAGGDEIVDVLYSTTTTENGQITATATEKSVSYVMVKQGGAWKVDSILN